MQSPEESLGKVLNYEYMCLIIGPKEQHLHVKKKKKNQRIFL